MHEASLFPGDAQRPRIALRHADQRALLAIAYGGLLSDTRSAGALLHEVSRADLMADDGPSITAGLWSRVLFREDRTDLARWVTLVPPQSSDDPVRQVSVLSPLGAALVGLSKGQHIRCPDRHGGEISLKVLDVVPPAQDPGDTP